MTGVNVEELQEMIAELEAREGTPGFTPLDAARLKACRAVLERLKNGTLVVESFKAESLADLEL